MKKTIAILLTIVMLLSLSAAAFAEEAKALLMIAEQGYFSAGGTVTEPVEGEYDPTQNWLDVTRAGNTAHVDHANVFYQIPAEETGAPIVYLHGYGQSRMGWMRTASSMPGQRIPRTISRAIRPGTPISVSAAWRRNATRAASSLRGMRHRISFSAR